MEEHFYREVEGGILQPTELKSLMKSASSDDQKHTSGGVLLQSTATWEQWLERKKGQLFRSQATDEELPKHG